MGFDIKNIIGGYTGGLVGGGKAPTDSQSGFNESSQTPDITSGYEDAHPLAQVVASGDTGFWNGMGQANTPANNSLTNSDDFGNAIGKILGQTKVGQGINFAKKAYNSINPTDNSSQDVTPDTD